MRDAFKSLGLLQSSGGALAYPVLDEFIVYISRASFVQEVKTFCNLAEGKYAAVASRSRLQHIVQPSRRSPKRSTVTLNQVTQS